jgi:hypothetical protein
MMSLGRERLGHLREAHAALDRDLDLDAATAVARGRVGVDAVREEAPDEQGERHGRQDHQEGDAERLARHRTGL